MSKKHSICFPRLYHGLIIGVPPAVRQMTADKIQQLGKRWPKQSTGPGNCYGAGDNLCWYASVSVRGTTMALVPPFGAPDVNGNVIRPTWYRSVNSSNPSKLPDQWLTIWMDIYDNSPALTGLTPVVNTWSGSGEATIPEFIRANNLAIAGGVNQVGHVCDVPIGFTPSPLEDLKYFTNKLYWSWNIGNRGSTSFAIYEVLDVDVKCSRIDSEVYGTVYKNVSKGKFNASLDSFLKQVQVIPDSIDTPEFRDVLGCSQRCYTGFNNGTVICTHARTKQVFIGCAGNGKYVTVCEDCKKEV